MDQAFDTAHVERLEAPEHEGYRDFYRAAPRALVDALGILCADIAGATCHAVKARPASILWNHAMGLGRARPASEEDLDAVIAFFDKAGVKGAIALAPDARPEALEDWIRGRGFQPGYPWRKFERDTADIPAYDIDLAIEAIDKAQGADFGLVVARAFEVPDSFAPWLAALAGRPDWHCFLARDGERPAGAGALYVSGDCGWLTFGATMPEYRRRGIQRALLAARMAAARRLGCARLLTDTGESADGSPESSYRNILWSGFERAYLRPNFVRDA